MRVDRQLVAGGRYDELLTRLGAPAPIPAVGFAVWIERLNEIGSAAMSAPFVLAVPSKGRLQENAEAFFARAGPASSSSRAARANIAARSPACPASRSPISRPPTSPRSSALGAVHFGVTGEDQIREMYSDAEKRVVLIDKLGFGEANVVVAVPQAWIDVRTMADLDDVATAFRATHDRKMRVATKYVNLTRQFFSRARHHRLPHRREPRRDRGRARRRHRRADRRHHHHRRDARRQRR